MNLKSVNDIGWLNLSQSGRPRSTKPISILRCISGERAAMRNYLTLESSVKTDCRAITSVRRHSRTSELTPEWYETHPAMAGAGIPGKLNHLSILALRQIADQVYY